MLCRRGAATPAQVSAPMHAGRQPAGAWPGAVTAVAGRLLNGSWPPCAGTVGPAIEVYCSRGFNRATLNAPGSMRSTPLASRLHAYTLCAAARFMAERVLRSPSHQTPTLLSPSLGLTSIAVAKATNDLRPASCTKKGARVYHPQTQWPWPTFVPFIERHRNDGPRCRLEAIQK